MRGQKSRARGQRGGTYLRLHLTHTLHRESTKGTFNLGRCRRSARERAAPLTLYSVRESRDHRGRVRTRTSSAQRWKQPVRDPHPVVGRASWSPSPPAASSELQGDGLWDLRPEARAAGMVGRLQARLGARRGTVFSLSVLLSPRWSGPASVYPRGDRQPCWGRTPLPLTVFPS